MSFVIPKDTYSGKIPALTIGQGAKAITIGGENTLPFLSFEGGIPKNIPVALEIQDVVPTDWPESVKKPYGKSLENPVTWAKFCQDDLKADMVCLRLAGTHPDQENRSPEEAAKTVEEVLKTIDIPLIILGCGHVEKDAEVVKKYAEVAAGTGSIIGKAQEKNYKTFAGVAMAYNLYLIALSDLDINLSKQLNILLTQMDFDKSKIIIDAMSSTLGYGLEYTYSVMERIRLAALQQNDAMMQMPIVSDISEVTWKVKECKATEEEEPHWGSAEERGILWEAMTALSFLMAGGNFTIMRHPKAMELLHNMVKDLV